MNASILLNDKAIAAHVLRYLAAEGSLGRLVHLDEIADEIGVRSEDVRHVISRLHAEGHVDAKRMKLTFTGLALAAAMSDCVLRNVRIEEAPQSKVA